MSNAASDSSGSASPSPPPPPSHYAHVRDACTGGPVRHETQLAALHTFGTDPQEDLRLKNITRITQPAVRCRMKVDDSDWLCSTTGSSVQGFLLYLTYNSLTFAPRVRLECRFIDRSSATVYHVIALEFSFCADNGTALQEYSKDGSRVTFRAIGATPIGLGCLDRHQHRFGTHEHRILDHLRALLRPGSSTNLQFELNMSGILEYQRKELSEIDKRLPGGCGPLFDSLTQPEYFALDATPLFSVSKDKLKRPSDMMNSHVPFPMVPLAPRETFSSEREAQIHLSYSSFHSELETEQSVKLWAESTHRAALFRLPNSDIPVLAVRFRDYKRLGGVREELKFKLPRELQTKATFAGDKTTEHNRQLELVLDEISGLPRHDAAFMMLNEGGIKWLEKIDKTVYNVDDPFPDFVDIDFDPDLRSFMLNSILATCNKLHASDNPWTTHILNQDTSQLEDVDLTSGIYPNEVREADEWLWTSQDWNEEQAEALRCIKQTKGGMVIVKGVAGTGKTLLQCKMSLYFARMRFKVLVAPPSNSNASHTALEINSSSEQGQPFDEPVEDPVCDGTSTPVFEGSDPDFEGPECDPEEAGEIVHDNKIFTPTSSTPIIRRLFANSLGQSLRQLSRKQAQFRGHHHSNGSSSSIESLNFLLHSVKDRRAGGREYAVEQAVIDEAERRRFKLFGKDDVGRIKPDVDVWDIFREHLQACREDKFNWNDKALKDEYEKAYEFCKGHVVASADILVTTTGNARSAEIMQHWLRSEEDYGIPSQGVIVFCDEAFKDTEVGTWNAIMAPGLQTKGVFMFGDDFQLAPTNTTSKGKLVFGQFNEQLDIALPSRLIKHGFPYIYLKEQQRMHPCISKFPNEEFYSGELRDGPRVHVTLDAVMPRLSDVLHGIIHKSYSTVGNNMSAQHYLDTRTDEKARHHYLEVDGTRRTGGDGTSKYVQEHIDVFFNHVFPALQEYFRDTTAKNLMIICAYSATRAKYHERFERLQDRNSLPDSWFPTLEEISPVADASSSASSDSGIAPPPPTVARKRDPDSAYSRSLTIDASQGQESFMVFMDGAFQYRDQIGFMTDRGRCNVAMTRAKGVFWTIGGSLSLSPQRRGRGFDDDLSPFPKLKQEMARLGRVHRFKP